MPTTPGVTITGKLEDLAGNNNAGKLIWTLQNFGDFPPRVSGTMMLTPVRITTQAAADGTFSQVLWGNYQLAPSNTFYQCEIQGADGSQVVVAAFQFNSSGSFDLSTMVPISGSNPPIFIPTAVTSFNGRTGTVLPANGDYSFSQISGTVAASQLPTPTALTLGGVESLAAVTSKWIDSISTSGVPHASQPAFSDISGTVAASQLPIPGPTSLGGVKSLTASSHLFITGLGTDGVLTTAQPAFTDISGTASVGQIPSLPASQITSGLLALARGGTGVDLSASGGTTAILAQDASHVISARNLVAADIPNISALKITSGLLALAQGGTGADLSATGGASQVLKQTTLGGTITVGQLAFSDISGTAAASQLPNPSASTLGGIESIAAVSHKWINSISTSGVPNLTQPAAADLSDGTIGTGSHVLMATTVTGSGTQAVLAVSPNLSGAVLTGTTTLAGTAVPDTAGGENLGSASLPFGNLYIGGAATNNIKVTGTATAARTLTIPDADTITVQPFGGVAHQFVTSIQTTGQVLSARVQASDLQDGTTGSGLVVLATSPALVTPTLGVASATSINKMAITAPATSSTLAVADGKTLTANNTLTFAGTDSTTLTFQGNGTVVNRDSTDTLTHKTIDTAGTGNHIQLGGVDLPASIGTSGQVLTNSSGVLAFTTVSGGGGGTPGGATNSIQYNDGTTFAGSMCLTPAGTIAPNAVFKSSIKTFSATGNSDLYTCPANKRAIVTEMTVFNGHATNSSTLVAMLKIGGVYYPASASASVGAQQTGSRSVTYVLEAGEILAVNMTQQPFNVVVSIMEFDNTSNLKSAKLTTPTLASGDNTIYTVPNGKSALVLNNTLTMCSGTQGTFTAGNNSGGNITYKWNVVPSGGSVGTTNQMSASVTISNGAGSSQTLTGFTMGAGDFISVNASAGTSDQIAFVTVVEI
jgi:hypothetical protein